MRMVLGIDPGLSGAMALLTAGGDLDVWDMPTLQIDRNGKQKRELDLACLVTSIRDAGATECWFEKVGAMPGQGVSSMFAFGRAVGQVEAAIAACGIPISYVTPQAWKRQLSVPTGKDAARLRASQLMPAYATEWRLVKHDGRAEAALIALYGLLHGGTGR